MKNETKWNTELALELESLFYKDSVPEEWIEIIDKLNQRWQGIANLISFDYIDEDVVKKIEDFFPVTDEKSPLHIFDDAEEAIDFFQDMRTIKARRAWFFIRTTKESYSPSVQALIKICCEIIDASPVEYHHRPICNRQDTLPVANGLDCIGNLSGEQIRSTMFGDEML